MVKEEAYFTQKIEAFQSRIEDLLRQEAVGIARQNPLVKRALEELENLLEELQVAREELRQKDEQLFSVHEEIEAERQRYQDLFEFAPDGYLITDEAGKILEANQTAAWMLNVDPGYLIGKMLISFIPLGQRQDFRSRLSGFKYLQTSTNRPATGWEIQFIPRAGEPFWALVVVARAQRIMDEKMQVETLRWMIHDITRRKETQLALQEARDELEKRVEERTSQLRLANEKLQSVASQLESRNRELQDFAFIASHDLQEPLRKIHAFGSRLKKRLGDSLDEESAEYLDRMVAAASRMQAMIDGLLSYARVTTRTEPFSPVDLREVAWKVILELDVNVARSKGRVEVGELPVIKADPNQMYQLMQNLITNALKFRQPKVPPLVKVWGVEGSPEQVIIFVQDNGIGIDSQYRDQLFQPFQRLHGQNEYKGSGMGLAICRRIVERHGGEIDFTSVPGEGTTFRITLGQNLPQV